VVGDLELFDGLQAGGVDAVDAAPGLRPVLRHRDPAVDAVEVDTARVVPVALAEEDVALQVPREIQNEQVTDPLAGRAAVTARARRLCASGACR